MSTDRQMAIRDLLEEAKKRIVFLVVCVVGLSYLMSLTSSSVLVNLPAAASLIIILRYLSLDLENRRKTAAYNSKPPAANTLYQKKPVEGVTVVDKSEWRKRVNSPVVEDAIDHFTRHLISEWVTDLWYARITPDKEGPEELVLIINGVLGEISCRMRNINLIHLLTRDLVNILSTHLEIFRVCQAKIKKELDSLTLDERDMELKVILAKENKLHPALFSASAEHKVLQHLMNGLISFTFRPEDLKCSFFRYAVRELIACAVIRPVLNLVTPRFINEKIESVVISKSKATKAVATAQEDSRSSEPSKISSDHFSRFPDPSVTGVELVQLKNGQSVAAAEKKATNNVNGNKHSKDPLLSIDTRTSRTWSSLPSGSLTRDAECLQHQRSGGEWGEVLDLISHRKTQALAPENFENMWTKGRNFKKGVIGQNEKNLHKSPQRTSDTVERLNSKQTDEVGVTKVNLPNKRVVSSGFSTSEKHLSSLSTHQEDDENKFMPLEEEESASSSSYTTDEEEAVCITGLDSPGTKVWDGKKNKNLPPSHIRHPLESSVGRKSVKTNAHFQRLSRSQSGRKRTRFGDKNGPIWQEVERTSFLSGDGQDILKPKRYEKFEESSDDSEVETLGRVYSGADASSSAPSDSSILKSHSLESNSVQNALLEDSFMKLRCEVLGANIVKSGSRTFAVYSISVTDANNHSWSIKRRFRHFEELHRRLKEFRGYSLHLPPKHYLSTGLELSVIRERCILLDSYLKKLLRLPIISGSIEVWDFLSIDSQTYIFSNSISIVETLSVNLDENIPNSSSVTAHFGTGTNAISSKKEQLRSESKAGKQIQHNFVANGSRQSIDGTPHSPVKKTGEAAKGREGVGLQGQSRVHVDAVADPALPKECMPPNLSVPILDLVDVILQLQDGGWIRRQAFWVAKQILQLGMGDAFDDWLIEKIQLLRKGSVVASGIKRVEQILWPDGIFLTKHPNRQKPPPPVTPSSSFNSGIKTNISSPRAQDNQEQEKDNSLSIEDQQQQEATRRAKFVYELMIDNPPAAVTSLVGRKEYEQCAKDLYFFLQSSVCLKQLALDILELILVSAFPELDNTVKELREQKHKFGEFKVS